eukprot:6472555-Amphidinium_carterae.1
MWGQTIVVARGHNLSWFESTCGIVQMILSGYALCRLAKSRRVRGGALRWEVGLLGFDPREH